MHFCAQIGTEQISLSCKELTLTLVAETMVDFSKMAATEYSVSVAAALIKSRAPLFLFCQPGIQPHTSGATQTDRLGQLIEQTGSVQSEPFQPARH